jgi:hypothetical protein
MIPEGGGFPGADAPDRIPLLNIERRLLMPKNQFVDFKAVKSAVSMEQTLQHYGLLEKLKRSGDSLTGACPIHRGSNPTQFRVSLGKNLWNCFSDCKGGGNGISCCLGLSPFS